MGTREERREEERRYEGDVWYEVWRSGGNPDRVDLDRVSDAFYDGLSTEDCASRELRRQRPTQPQSEEQQWPDEQQP